MARKGREALVVAPPPAASSSDDDDDDDEDSSSDDEQQQPLPSAPAAAEKSQSSSSSSESEEEGDEEEEEEDDDDEGGGGGGGGEEEEEEEEDQPPKQNSPPPKKKAEVPKPAESDSDSGSDSDSDLPPPKKLTVEAAKPNLPASVPPVTVLAAPAPTPKRRGSETDKGSTPKKAKKEEVEPTAQEEGKKPLFQRLWSEDDEIAILQGIIDFKAEKGVDPMADGDAFVEFVKKSLHVDVNKVQIMGKIRSLRRRLETALKKKKITDPHGLKLFELSKKIWESDEAKNNGVVNGKDSNFMSPNVKKRARSGEKLKGGKNEPVSGDGGEKVHEFVFSRREMELHFEDFVNFGVLREGVLKEGMKLLRDEEKAKLAEKLKKQNMLEMEAYLNRLDLVREITQKILNAIKSA